jgi:hypothetical protein
MPLSQEAQRYLAKMTRDRAEFVILKYESAGLDSPEVDAAYAFLSPDNPNEEAAAPGDRVDRDTPDPPAGWDDTGEGSGAAPGTPAALDWPTDDAEPTVPSFAAADGEAAESDADEEAISPIEFMLERDPYRGQYMRVPLALIPGEIGALLERACPGLAWLVVVLLRYASWRDHVVSASKLSIRKDAGIGDDRTLDRRIALLCTGKPELGLPPLLRRLPGYGARFAFRQDGLAALIALAQRTVADREARFAAIRRARRQGGTQGMQRRWERPR